VILVAFAAASPARGLPADRASRAPESDANWRIPDMPQLAWISMAGDEDAMTIGAPSAISSQVAYG
jgi:hypothetical protein